MRCRTCHWRGWEKAEPGPLSRPRERSSSSYAAGRETALGACLVLVIVGVIVAVLLAIGWAAPAAENPVQIRSRSQAFI